MDNVCAIHQPNFFPWLGYFDKMKKADVFVYLDAVDYPKSGSGGMGSWSNRVKIDIQGKAAWIGCTVGRFRGAMAIKDVKISDAQPWRKKLIRTLEMNYARAPNFRPVMDMLEPLIRNPERNLADYNIHAIETLRTYLEIDVKTVRQSDLESRGSATELLINITKDVGCQAYLCGAGASGYQDDSLFQSAELDLVYQSYSEEPYCHPNQYIFGLSVIDYIMKR